MLVMEIFHKLHKAGSTIIVVTHDPEVAEQADRMVVLEHGKLARIEKMKH
jgi:ABC transporter, ATP-binding protein, putative